MNTTLALPPVETWLYLLLACVTFVYSRVWSLPFILIRYFGWRIYIISKNTDINFLRNYLQIKGSHIQDDKPLGLFYGKWYVGILNRHEDRNERFENEIIMLCLESMYKKIIDARNMLPNTNNTTNTINTTTNTTTNNTNNTTNNSNDNDENPMEFREQKKEYSKIAIYTADLHVSTGFEKHETVVKFDQPLMHQKLAIDEIMRIYNKNNNCVALISGVPCTGKSILSLILAAKLDATYCDEFDPFNRASSLSNLYFDVYPTKEKPLIICMDEIDIPLTAIHNKQILQHKYYRYPIMDKVSWSQFFDKINNGLFPYMILIMTSNKDREYFDGLDSAYMRYGRINYYVKFDKVIDICNEEEKTAPVHNETKKVR